jgi:hypothetical protein
MNLSKLIHATIFLTTFTTLNALGGCSTTLDQGSQGDAAARREECTEKVRACINRCAKSGLGSACDACCQRNGMSCDVDGGYSFYSCPDEE